MNPATIAALATAIPAILGAITALIVALKSHGVANNASTKADNAINSTITSEQILTDHLRAHDGTSK